MNQTIKIPETYSILKSTYIEELKSEALLLKHKKSGARIAVLSNEDINKVFHVAFRTPPKDSTGVAHILEHSVLCGSDEFPVKDPFVELVKGSLNTFLNAMTYSDKTVYPVASCNDADFQNLMHVYLDAVFRPNIYKSKEIFLQEGWHYELESKDAPLKYNGVVYNEMKGAFSSPEQVLYRKISQTLYPDTTYGVESGGDPANIPDLSYEEFLDFHKRYYHPSNAWLYLYGNMDVEEKLQFIDEHYLSHYDSMTVDSSIQKQPPFEKMQEVRSSFAVTDDNELKENTYLSYNVVIGTSLDRELYLAMQILEYVLMSSPGAVLKKALLESGIGKDVFGELDNGVLQPYMSIIVKNAEAGQKDDFLKIIRETLSRLADEGINRKSLMAAINYYEFKYREGDFGRYPAGLMYGLQMMDSWLYDDEKPFIHIEALDTFEFLKKQIGTGYYEELIQKYLLDNTHGAIVIVKPEKGRTAQMDRELEEKLQVYKNSLSAGEQEALVERTKALEAYQSAPDDEEDLAKIPILKREDISRDIEPIINEEMNISGIPVVFHEIETNGIGYVDVMFDLSGVPEEMLPYVGILQSVLGIIDTEHFEYGALFNEINMHTGGIGTSLELYSDVTNVREKAFRATFEIKAKALYAKLPVAFDMMAEILTQSKLEDEKRLKEILAMLKSRLLMKFQSSGHTTAALRAMSYSSPSAKLKDMTNGIEFYEKVAYIEEHFEEEKGKLVENLKNLARQLFRANNMMLSYTAAKEGLQDMETMISSMKASLNHEEPKDSPCMIHCQKKNEGFKTASKVQYVARTGNFIDNGASYTGALQILKVILSYEYLWQNIRVKGGAYGCMSNFNRIGEGYFVSYRDPNLRRTLEVYDGVVDYLKDFTVSERDMTKYIIGTMSNIDQPMTPAAKGDRSMNLYMNKVSAEMIQKERREILEAGQDDIRRLSKVVEAVLKADQLCVIGSEEKIEEERNLFGTVTSF